jgi:membrane fusion protein (multidrug efflux system)
MIYSEETEMAQQAEVTMSGSPDAATSSFASDSTQQASPSTGRNRLIVIILLLVVAVVAILWWLRARRFEATDDAQIDGHFNAISTRISGTVAYVNPDVENDYYVKAGTLLLELDPRDYQAELEHAQAALETKEATARSAQVNVPITDATAFSQLRAAEAAHNEALANVRTEQANLVAAERKVDADDAIASRAERDRVRYLALVEKREVSRSFYDAQDTEAKSSAQALDADRAIIIAEREKISQLQSVVAERQAQVDVARTAPQQVIDARDRSRSGIGERDQARADVHTAELNLSYTKVYAPVSGVIGRKTVELGHRVQPGQSLLIIVPVDDIWVTANFKETQLGLMKPGQPVTIHVDTFRKDYKGTVEEMAGAAGPLFSLFPPENASGNYVKVVQRFPVRIHFDKDQDPEHLLRPGMSVEPTVKVR